MEIAAFNAVDIDTENNSKITYSLDKDSAKYFQIDSSTGVVRILNSLAGLARPDPYIIKILAIDQGNPPLSAMTQFQVRIHETISSLDSQEIRINNPPVGFCLNLTENTPPGLIYKVEADLSLLGDSIEVDLLHYSLEVGNIS